MEREEGSSSPSYYTILGVSSESSPEEIKRAYRKLAMQWHPDRWTRTPALLAQAKCKFQKVQEAYSVLSDRRKRALYDAGLYDPEEEEDEGFTDFMNELLSLMAQNKREEKYHTMEELQTMLMEMARGFEFPSGDSEPSIFDDPGKSKRLRCDFNQELGGGSCYSTLSGWGVCNTRSYCS